MIESLIWMFKTKKFKNHFLFLLSFEVILFLFGLLLILLAVPFRNTFFASALIILSIVCFIVSFLFLQGYFWELTEAVIKRDTDIDATTHYNGKIKVINIIKLPELKFKRLIWRGIASIVASVILFIPVIYILLGLSITAVDTIKLLNMNTQQTILMYKYLVLFICMFIPALLYNYASKDSVFAVLNLPHAIYLIGNYTWRYFKNTFLFLIFLFSYAFLMNMITTSFGLNFSTASAETGHNILSISGANILFSGIILLFFTLIFRIYFIYVNAYLLGTIAPKEEW